MPWVSWWYNNLPGDGMTRHSLLCVSSPSGDTSTIHIVVITSQRWKMMIKWIYNLISLLHTTQELCWKCILHPFTQDSCWYMVRWILSLLIWKVYELTSMSELRNVKSACDVWELCHKLLNCLNLQLCSVERSLNIILSLIFRCARAGSTISWVMEQGWKGSTVPRYWLRSSCSPAGQWLTVC